MGLQFRSLVVENDIRTARQIAGVLRRHMEVAVASTFGCARALIEERELDLLVIHIDLPDGVGFDLLPPARARQPQVAALMITSDSSVHINHRAFELGVPVLRKPFGSAPISELAARALKRRCPAVHDLRLHVRAFATRYELSAREADVVALVAKGYPRARVAGALGVQETTVKTLLTRIRKKVGADSVSELISGVWSCELGAGGSGPQKPL